MKKSTRIVKRLLALFLVVLMSIESIGAVVSDNDGSAFITKAEFDSLKNNFQAQIDQYNTSIDSKIDGAIANYLAGIDVMKTEHRELDLNEYILDKVTWGSIGFSSKFGSTARTVPNTEFLLGQDETYCGITYWTTLGANSKISEGGFDLSYLPEYDMGYLDFDSAGLGYLESWGIWKPHYFGSTAAFYEWEHVADDNGNSPEWYGFMKSERETDVSTLNGNEWLVVPKSFGDSVTRWTLIAKNNNKWERGVYQDTFISNKDGLVLYPLSTSTNKFRNYQLGERIKLKSGFSHKLTDVFKSHDQVQGVRKYPWSNEGGDWSQLNLGEANPPNYCLTPYLTRLQQDGSEAKYSYKWMNVKYKNWTKDDMVSTWPDWLWHGGPYTYMGWVSINTTNSLFSSVQSKLINLKSKYYGLVPVNCGLAIWKNENKEGNVDVAIKMSESGHVILYTDTNPDPTWGGTTNILGGRERDYSEAEVWITSKQWQSNVNNHIVANTESTFSIENVEKGDILFFLFLPDDDTKVAKIKSLKLTIKTY